MIERRTAGQKEREEMHMKKNQNNTEILSESIDTEEFLNASYEEAQEIMEDRGKLEKLLKRLERKLRGVPKLGNALAYIPRMGMLVFSWLKGEGL